MTEFFQTVMGNRFYECTMPSLVRQLERLNKNLERLMDREDAKLAEAQKFIEDMNKENERLAKERADKIAKEWAAIPVPDEEEEGAGHDMDRCAKHHNYNCPDCHPMQEDAEER